MNHILDVASMEFSADISGAVEETRGNPRVIISAIEAAAKIIIAVIKEM